MTDPRAPDAAIPLRRYKSFMRLWFSRLASTSANQMLMVAVGWQMYDLTGRAWDLGLVGLLQFVPALALVLVAGHVVDRYDRSRILLEAGPFVRAWRAVLLWASRWFQIESLFRFNAKFRPTWEPRFVCYPRSSDLPRITMAALEAEAFIVWPKPRWATGRSEGTTPVGAGTGQA